MDRIKQLEKEYAPLNALPAFKAGDTVTVHYKIVEGNKERIQQFQGVVIQRKGSGSTATFTVRKISNNIGVERIFPIASPFIDKIEVNKRGAWSVVPASSTCANCAVRAPASPRSASPAPRPSKASKWPSKAPYQDHRKALLRRGLFISINTQH
jgi:large subunit ribosomal protein L19